MRDLQRVLQAVAHPGCVMDMSIHQLFRYPGPKEGQYRSAGPRKSIRTNTLRPKLFPGFGKWTEMKYKPLVCASVTGFWEIAAFSAYVEAGASGGVRLAGDSPELSHVS